MKRIRNLIFVLLLFGSFFISRCYAKDALSMDGRYWQYSEIPNEPNKVEIIECLRGNLIIGFLMKPDNIIDIGLVDDAIKEDTEVNSYTKITWKMFKESTENLDISGITVGQIKDGVNKFYEDFANRKIKIVDAIYVVKMQIQGKDPDLINAQIRYLKMQPISHEEFERAYNENLEKEQKGEKPDAELLLKMGIFINREGHKQGLFCYGRYAE